MRGLSIRTKVFLLFAGAALLTVVPALVLIGRAVEERVYERATLGLREASEALRRYWSVQDEALQERARRLSQERGVEELIDARDTTRLRRMLVRGVAKGQLVLATDSAGTPLVGPALDSATLQAGSDFGSIVSFPSGSSTPIRVSVWPVWTDSGRVGIVGVGSRLDPGTIRDLKGVTGGEVALVVGDSVVATTLADSVVRALKGLDLPAMLQRGGTWRIEEKAPYLLSVNPLPTRERPTAVLVFRSVAEELRIVNGIKQSVVYIGLVTLVIALLLALLVARIVARPAQALAAAASDLARGNYGAPLPHAGGDEIGQLTRAFREMRSAIAEREARLRSAQAELIHREKLAAMGRLVAQLSHEINNPIYNIQNCLEVLDRRGHPDDPNREFLELAREELSRMAMLTRQLLDQSRPLAEAARPLDLNQLTQRVITLAQPTLAAHGIQCEMSLQPELPLVVAHPDAIQQVLANLVDNAIDAMPGGGRLRLVSRADADAVEVVVEDTGAGIAEEHLPHIFEAFFTTKPGVRGIGLGLFVSEGIIRGHRGRLLVESRAGEGSRFIVQLPRETLDAALSDTDALRSGAPAAV